MKLINIKSNNYYKMSCTVDRYSLLSSSYVASFPILSQTKRQTYLRLSLGRWGPIHRIDGSEKSSVRRTAVDADGISFSVRFHQAQKQLQSSNSCEFPTSQCRRGSGEAVAGAAKSSQALTFDNALGYRRGSWWWGCWWGRLWTAHHLFDEMRRRNWASTFAARKR